MSSKQPRVIRDGKVAVLYSPDFGAGWSTWAGDNKLWALFAPAVVEWVESGKDGDIDEIVKAELGDDYLYTGGAYQLVIAWLPEGTKFIVNEYDGNESIQVQHDDYWEVA